MAELIVELSPKEIAEGHQRRRRFWRVSFDLTWDEYADLCGVLPEEYARPEEYLRAIALKLASRYDRSVVLADGTIIA